MERETRFHAGDIYKESDLKICELCGGLNLAANAECFVCGWHGKFETRARVVRLAMDLVIGRYGELKRELLTDSLRAGSPSGLTAGLRLKMLLLRVRRWILG